MIDVDKLLRIDYLNEFIAKFNEKIEEEQVRRLDSYSLDMILSMEEKEIIEIFNKYGLKCDSIIEKKDSVFLDETWEFHQLFKDDLMYSLEQKKQLDASAWYEVLELNKKIELYNDKVSKAIDKLKERVRIVELLIDVIQTKDIIYGDSINELKRLILTSPLIKDSDRFTASMIVVKYLIKEGKKIIFNRDNIETEEFNKLLDAVHETSTYKESKEDELLKSPYQEILLNYYNKYKNLIDAAGYSDIFELIDSSSNVLETINGDRLSKDDFCFQIGGFLYQLCNIGDEILENEILVMLSKLDLLYQEDQDNADRKNKMLFEIDGFFSKLDGIDIALLNKLRTRLKVLKSDLDEIISNSRIEELELEFNDIKKYIDKLNDILNLVKKVNEYSRKITDIFSSYNLDDADSELLSSLQNKLSEYEIQILNEREFEDVNSELFDYFIKIDEIQDKLVSSKYVEQSNKTIDNKVLLKGFILCDFDENNKPYILSDLDPSIKNKMIDKSIEPKKLKKGYEAYSKLINDLFLLGNTEKLDNNDSFGYNTDRLNEPVYWDTKNKTHDNETGMYRLKGERNGVERFVEQRIVLHSGTVIYKQVINIISEIIPNIEFDSSMDINLYINYASAMKKDDKYLYSQAIIRFVRKSPLYKMFNEPKNKTELSEKECELLKDIIHASLDAFSRLKDISPDLHVDVIKQIEEGRTRG